MKTTKRIYESMYIVDSSLTDEQVDSIIAKYSNLISDQGGEVKAVGRWDKRRLAYDVMGHRDGLYILMFFESEPEAAKELDRVYRISDDVFRHLITRVEAQHVDTSRIDHPLPSTEAAPVADVEEAIEQPAEAEAPAAEATEEAVPAAEAEAPAAEAAEEAAPAAEAEEAAEAPAEEAAEAPEAEAEETPAAEAEAEEAPAESTEETAEAAAEVTSDEAQAPAEEVEEAPAEETAEAPEAEAKPEETENA